MGLPLLPQPPLGRMVLAVKVQLPNWQSIAPWRLTKGSSKNYYWDGTQHLRNGASLVTMAIHFKVGVISITGINYAIENIVNIPWGGGSWLCLADWATMEKVTRPGVTGGARLISSSGDSSPGILKEGQGIQFRWSQFSQQNSRVHFIMLSSVSNGLFEKPQY